MEERWASLCGRLGAPDDAGWLYGVIEALHAFPPRVYHTIDHVAACLRTLDAFEGPVQDRCAVEFSLWFHDCVYDPTRPDNEDRSARVAEMVAARLGCTNSFVREVALLITATRHDGVALAGDAAVVADADLSILAAPWEEYAAYAAGIRREYAHASDAQFAAGRSAFLGAMLEQDRIFHTDWMRARCEERARRNIAREVSELSRRGGPNPPRTPGTSSGRTPGRG